MAHAAAAQDRSYESMLQKAVSEIERIQHAMEQIRATNEEATELMEEEIRFAEQLAGEAQSRIEETAWELKTQCTRVRGSSTANVRHQSDVARLSRRGRVLRGAVRTLEQQMSVSERQHRVAAQTNADLRRKLREMRSENQELRNRVEALRTGSDPELQRLEVKLKSGLEAIRKVSAVKQKTAAAVASGGRGVAMGSTAASRKEKGGRGGAIHERAASVIFKTPNAKPVGGGRSARAHDKAVLGRQRTAPGPSTARSNPVISRSMPAALLSGETHSKTKARALAERIPAVSPQNCSSTTGKRASARFPAQQQRLKPVVRSSPTRSMPVLSATETQIAAASPTKRIPRRHRKGSQSKKCAIM